jgi:hypothetical protein
MSFSKIFLLAIFLTTTISCGFVNFQKSQNKTDDEDSNENYEGEEGSTSTIEEGKETTVEHTTGPAAGSNITVPAGALPPGSLVAIQSVDSPAEFGAVIGNNDEILPASTAVLITASDKAGSDVTPNSPMTIQLTVSGNNLAESKSLDRVCAVLKGMDGEQYVWRAKSIEINSEKTKATFTSGVLGIFQLLYCGTESMDGFNEQSAEDDQNDGSGKMFTAIFDNKDSLENDFSLSFLSSSAIPAGATITKIKWDFSTSSGGVYLDTVQGGNGLGSAWGFNPPSSNPLGSSSTQTDAELDGGTSLEIEFTNFTKGDEFNFTIDTESSAGNFDVQGSEFDGTQITVTVSDDGEETIYKGDFEADDDLSAKAEF